MANSSSSRRRSLLKTLATCVLGGIAGVPVAFSMAWAYENAHPEPLGPYAWATALVHAQIAIYVGFVLGFAFTLAICAWRESSGTARKIESAASDLE
jgi:hypothetical protein